MGFYYKLIIFFAINFGALMVGRLLQGEGARSLWYQGLNIAPWTPPGWVFGLAWFSIMFCFSFYMAYATDFKVLDTLMVLFIIQLILNIGWNPAFFRFHQTGLALGIIVLLTFVMGYFFFSGLKSMPWKSLLVLPYFAWLLLAASLNLYALIKN